MEFNQIRYFLAAADHMNFTRAAEACGVSQPSLTVAIRKLEEELGGRLFLREGVGVRLTELGRKMRTHLALIDETRRAASDVAAELVGSSTHEVNLAVFSTIGPRSLCGAIGAFRTARPDVRLVLHDVWGPRAYDLLLSGAVDCALVARSAPQPERIEAFALYTEPMVAAMAANHPLASGPVTAADLARYPYFDRLRCEFRDDIQADLTRRGIPLRPALMSEPEDWVQSAIAASQGITILPRDQVIVSGVVTRPVEDMKLERVIEIAKVRGRRIPDAAQALMRFLGDVDWDAESPASADA